MAFARALALVMVLAAAAPAAAESSIYRVDSATAVISGKRLIVTARGAVRSGGWEKPRLVLQKPEKARGELEFDFVATPPDDSAVVVHALMPVTVRITTRLPRSGMAAVRVNAETNTVIAQIISRTDRAHTARK